MFENKVVLTNMSKFSGGEIQAISKTGIQILDFSQAHLITNCEDILIFSGGQERHKMLDAISKLPKNAKIGWWMCDFRNANHFNSITTKLVDYMFVPYYNNHNDFMQFTKQGVYYMPQPGNEWIVDTGRTLNSNCVFIGNVSNNYYHSNRAEILKQISNTTSISVIWNESTTPDQSFIYKNTPISISISTSDMIGGSSNRLYNILAAGGFAFVKYFERIEELFNNHEHLVWFNDIKEIPDLLNMYLSDTDKLNTIKSNAKNIFNEKHTAAARLSNIFSIMNNTCNDFLGKICI